MVRQQEKPKKVTNKTPKATNKTSTPKNVDPVEETHDEVRLAFQTYVEAQKDLEYAVKEQEQQGENSHRNNERRYRIYEDIIDKAFAKRQEADDNAFALYRKTVEQVAAEYRKTLNQNLMECKQTTDNAWQASLTVREPAKTSLVSRFGTGFNSTKNILSRTAANTRHKLVGTYHRVVKPHSAA